MFHPHLIKLADLPPRRCIFTGRIDGPFVDTNVSVEPLPFQAPRGYVHEVAAFQIGQAVGMVTREEHARVCGDADVLRGRVAELEAENNDLSSQVDAIDGLTKAGLVVRKQTGRKPKERVDA